MKNFPTFLLCSFLNFFKAKVFSSASVIISPTKRLFYVKGLSIFPCHVLSSVPKLFSFDTLFSSWSTPSHFLISFMLNKGQGRFEVFFFVFTFPQIKCNKLLKITQIVITCRKSNRLSFRPSYVQYQSCLPTEADQI